VKEVGFSMAVSAEAVAVEVVVAVVTQISVTRKANV